MDASKGQQDEILKWKNSQNIIIMNNDNTSCGTKSFKGNQQILLHS